MLEKSLGNTNTMKLRAIFLLKANFITLYKIVFDGRLVQKFL